MPFARNQSELSDINIKVPIPSCFDGDVDFAVVVVVVDVDRTSFAVVAVLNGSDCWHCSEPVVVPPPLWR